MEIVQPFGESAGSEVTSVSNSDGSTTVSPTTGAVVISKNEFFSHNWQVGQSFRDFILIDRTTNGLGLQPLISWNSSRDATLAGIYGGVSSGLNFSTPSYQDFKFYFDASALAFGITPTLVTSYVALQVNGNITPTGIVVKRTVTETDATSITPNINTSDITYQLNTQAVGTLTLNAPTGTPTNGQPWLLKIKSTNVQTFSWNTVFAGGTAGLPVSTSGAGKIDYYAFIYDSVNSKYHFTGNSLGF